MNSSVDEDLLRQIESLKGELEAEREKNSFITGLLAGMSHDLRTPLNAIMGFSALLKEADIEGSESSMYSGMIIRSSKKLLSTLSHVIDYAKLELGMLQASSEKVNLAELLDEIREELEEDKLLFDKRDVQLDFSCAPNVPSFVSTDRSRLSQILWILLDNSLKHTVKGTIQVLCEPDLHGQVIFRIKDTGKGMDPATLTQLFSMFTDQEGVTPGKIQSRGLGMLIAKRLAGLMNGDLAVSSELKTGTTAVLSVPV